MVMAITMDDFGFTIWELLLGVLNQETMEVVPVSRRLPMEQCPVLQKRV